MSYSMEELSGKIMVATFKNVTNVAVLKESVVEDMRLTLVDLNLIVSEFHLKTATIKALVSEKMNKMKTKSISNEILYQLSSTTNINDATKLCGVNSESQLIAVISVDGESANYLKLLSDVSGEQFDAKLLKSEEFLNAEKVARTVKYFKLTAQELEFSCLDDAIATRLATKDYV